EPVKDVVAEDAKVTATKSFKEESNVVGELPDPCKKALDEFRVLVLEALNKHEFTASVPAPVQAPEEKLAEATEAAPVTELPAAECKEEEKDTTNPAPTPVEALEKDVAEVVVGKESCIDEDGAKKIEAIQETIVKTEVASAAPCADVTAEETLLVPEKVSIWGIPLLADDRSDVILLKFLRARDYKPKEALTMLKNVVAWRKEFDISSFVKVVDMKYSLAPFKKELRHVFQVLQDNY
ncbi:patellin-1, partial [Tanacetum coccineum]